MTTTEKSVEFGRFRLNISERSLLHGGVIVAVPPKAVEILAVLVEKQGSVVSKDVLIERVWPDIFVEEASITKNISLLRKVFSEHDPTTSYIETLPKRGYRLVPPVRVPAQTPEIAPDPVSSGTPRSLRPALLSILGVVLLAAIGMLLLSSFRSPGERIHSIAVMPFSDVEGTEGAVGDYVKKGLSDGVTADLTRVPGLKVKARQAVERVKDKTPGEVGREVEADAVLAGRAQRDNGEINVTIELIDSSSQAILWTHAYRRRSEDLLALQRDVSDGLTGFLRSRSAPDLLASRSKKFSDDPRAYDAYLQGRSFKAQTNPDGYRRAHQSFLTAVQIDPNFALAWVELSGTYDLMGLIKDLNPGIASTEMRASVRKALDIDPDLAEAHAENGWLIFNEWDFPSARKELERAVELDPNSAKAHFQIAWLYFTYGELDKAVSEGRAAHELDPLDPATNTMLGAWLLLAGRRDEALAQLNKTVELSPGYELPHEWIAYDDVRAGRLGDALRELDTAAKLTRYENIAPSRAAVLALAGRRDEAREVLQDLIKKCDSDKAPLEVGVAIVYAGLDEKDSAFEWLDRALTHRRYDAKFIRYIPYIDTLKDDPRFNDLLQRMIHAGDTRASG